MTAQPPAELIVVGSLNLDLVLRASHLPREGETITGAETTEGLGGKGANQAVAAARMGASVAFVGAVGDDPGGRHALARLEGEGVDVTGCTTRSGAATGKAAVIVDAAGRNVIVVADGANATLSPDDLGALSGLLPGADILLCQREVPLEAVDFAFAAASAAGIRTCLNTAPALELEGLATMPDLIVANRVEAETLTGHAGDGAEQLAQRLSRRFGSTAVVTDGGNGAAGFEGGARYSSPALSVEPVDTTGAGDAFVGALCAEMTRGAPLERALTVACAAGSMATLEHGAQPALPRLAAVRDALDREHGV